MTHNLCPEGRRLDADIDAAVEWLKRSNPKNHAEYYNRREVVFEAFRAYFYHKNGLPDGVCGCRECGGKL